MTTPMTFHRIAFEAVEVCNPVELSAVDRLLAATDLKPSDRGLDIGCGNATVSIRLAGHGLTMTAVERDPSMAALARDRVAAAGVENRVRVVESLAQPVLETESPWPLIVVMGATDAAAPGVRDPVEVFSRLRERLEPGGRLLWGEPFWKAEPSDAFRQLIGLTNTYESHEGWQATAAEAGFEIQMAEISSEATFAAFVATMDDAIRDWAAAHPDRPETASVVQRADLVKAMYENEGGRTLGFGMYLFRNPG